MSNRTGGERRRLLLRRGDIFRELTQMSHKGWDKFTSDDYKPLESELEKIKARLSALSEMTEQMRKCDMLLREYYKGKST